MHHRRDLARRLIASPPRSRFNSKMPELTRCRNPEAPEECWHIYYGDARVGTIAVRTGTPHDEDPWGWNCGFYPGSHPAECTDGTHGGTGALRASDQSNKQAETATAVTNFGGKTRLVP
jgi:hypothetical protein